MRWETKAYKFQNPYIYSSSARELFQTKSINRIHLNPVPRSKVCKKGMMRRGTKAQITKRGNVIGSQLIEGKFAEDRQVRSQRGHYTRPNQSVPCLLSSVVKQEKLLSQHNSSFITHSCFHNTLLLS